MFGEKLSVFNPTKNKTTGTKTLRILRNHLEYIVKLINFSRILSPKEMQTIKLIISHEIAAPLVPKLSTKISKIGK